MTARGFGWRRSACRREIYVVAERQRAGPALEAHQAQLLLAAGNPETAAAPVWRKVS